MGLVAFSFFHVFFSLETADEDRTIFSSQLLDNPTLLKASAASVLSIFPPRRSGHQRLLDTTELSKKSARVICTSSPRTIIVVAEVRRLFRRRRGGQAAEASVGPPALAGQPS